MRQPSSNQNFSVWTKSDCIGADASKFNVSPGRGDQLVDRRNQTICGVTDEFSCGVKITCENLMAKNKAYDPCGDNT